MKSNQGIKNGIISGIISTIIFLILIKPLSEFFWIRIQTTGSRVINSYIDALYTNAALGQRNYVNVLLFLFVMAGIFGIGIAFFIKLSVNDDINVEKDTKQIKDKIRSLKKTIKRLRIAYALTLLIFIALVSNISFKIVVDLQLNTTFKQRMTIIAPYISTLDEKKIYSKWALMKNRQDYVNINQNIENIAKSNNIKLPDVLY